jgi:prepilin-type N-terminal cleavage/methylation domain-containing protein
VIGWFELCILAGPIPARNSSHLKHNPCPHKEISIMSKPIKQTSQAGFTLVELAIVMIIIGLLIAGVLKGQELIANARVTSTVAQIKAIDAATSTFKDTYAGLPGDLGTPTTRLPNCLAASACGSATSAALNGDGKLDVANSFTAAAGIEARGFFPQLAAADLITGIIDNTTAAFGHDFPMSKIDGSGFIPGSVTTVSALDLPGAVNTTLGTPSGLYLALVNNAATAPGVAAEGLQPKQAGGIDLKLDDGVPGAGSVVGIGGGAAGPTDCGTTTTNVGAYNSSVSSQVCGLYVRIQG